jgi:alpha-ribazole phosphatase
MSLRRRLIAVRHAPVHSSGICYGRLDVPIGPFDGAIDGIVARTRGADRVVTSPSTRCRALAEAIAAALGLSLAIDERLTELDFGTWEGRSWEDIERTEPANFANFMNNWLTAAPPGGETVAALERRVASALTEASSRVDTPLFITHAGVVRALRVLVNGDPWREAMLAAVPHLEPIEFMHKTVWTSPAFAETSHKPDRDRDAG